MLLINSKDWNPNNNLMEGGREFYVHLFETNETKVVS